MEHDRTVPDEHVVFDDARLQVDDVTNHTAITDDRRVLGCRVQHRAVLHARPRSDLDLTFIATQHSTRPDRTLGSDRDSSDDDRVRMDERVTGDLRFLSAERVDGHDADGSRFDDGVGNGTSMVRTPSEAVRFLPMSRRIDIELTSALPDNSWTWRAAGAKQPKGTLDGSILSPGAGVGDVFKVEVEQEIDGINVLSVVDGRAKEERVDVLELLPSEREFKPVIETRAKKDRNDRGGRGDRGDRRPKRDRDDRGKRNDRGRGDKNDRGGRSRDDRGDSSKRDDRGGRRRGGPSFTPPPEIPQRPKPKRLKPGKRNRNAVLAELPDEQRGVAELALQGMGAVRQRLREENEKALKEGRSPMPEASVIKLAEDLLPKLRVAEWRDRAEAAQRQMEHLDLRDLRSVVAASGDPAVARDETTAALAAELTEALATKQEQELRLWFGDVDAALAVGRVIRALRLSSQPPKAGVPFPSDIAQRLVDSANASLAPMDSAERWIAMLEAAAFSPVRSGIAPVRKPDAVTDELLATVKRLAPALPQVAALFEIEVDPKASMPKPLRPGPRNKKTERDGGQRPNRQRDGHGKPANRSGGSDQKTTKNTPDAGGAPASETPADDTAPAAAGDVDTTTASTDVSAPVVVPAEAGAVETATPEAETSGPEAAAPDTSRPDAPAAVSQADDTATPVATTAPDDAATPDTDPSAAPTPEPVADDVPTTDAATERRDAPEPSADDDAGASSTS